jgi:hypothetical protein
VEKEDLKRVWMAVMFLMLVATAPNWINAEAQHPSGYEAPWVYPSLEPPAGHQ